MIEQLDAEKIRKESALEIYRAIETYRWLVNQENPLTDGKTMYDLILNTVKNYL